MRTAYTHITAPTSRSRQKFVGSLLLLLLMAFCFWGGTPGKAARNWVTRISAVATSPTATATFATITVNTTADDNTVNGNCTLREAIRAANTNAAVDTCTAGAAGLDNIVFNLGAGTPSIAVTGSALPDVTEPVVIDGATGGATRVELNGAAAGAGANGLVIKGGGSTIKALVVNRFQGNDINLVGAGGNTIVNCYLGTDDTGTVDPSPSNFAVDAVYIENSANNTIGGTTAGERNLISNNSNIGVHIFGATASGNKVIGNYIGTDVTGKNQLGNGTDGVQIQDAPNNTVGGTTAGERNIISGNYGKGVSILGATATGNKVSGNYIGTDDTGIGYLGNFDDGVNIQSANNIVGGTTPGERNVISGNQGNAVFVKGVAATNNKISGNYLGPDATGIAALGNSYGVEITDALNTVVGGTTPGERNIISGNFSGVVVFSQTIVTSGTKISGNYIGTDVTGAVALGNRVDGISFGFGNSQSIVGGTTPGERNVISGNGRHGINGSVLIVSGGTIGGSNKVIGNYIGTNAAGTAALGNTEVGIQFFSGDNLIGGTTAGERNLISGNGSVGIFIAGQVATNNKVRGNYIGTDVTGNIDIGNAFDGIQVGSAPNNIIGGTTPGERNVISGNDGVGISLYDPPTTGTKVIGNYIGTNATGMAALGNAFDGLIIDGVSNFIGGTTAGERNLISGNGRIGVFLIPGDGGNKITGNFIGTDVTGTLALGNVVDGVQMLSPNNIVGGTTVGERNIISANQRVGVLTGGAAATGNKVIGNYIGADVNGAVLGNVIGDGVNIQSSNNIVGGTTAAERNLIIGNGRNGVTIRLDTATGNKILGNSIFNNAALGIDLFPLGLSTNDAGDADTGANNLQNYPVLTGLTNTTITGTLDSLPANTSYPVRLEFFANTNADASGNGEGEVFLGTTTLAAPGAFTANYTPVAGKPFITATATDNAGNTSEFSPALISPPTVTITDPFSCSGPGSALTVRVAITNPAVISQTVSFTATLPAGLIGVPGSGTSSVGAAPTVTATGATFNATLAAGQTANVTYQVQVGDTVTTGTQLCITTASAVGAFQGPAVQACATVNCPAIGPGALPLVTTPLNDQRAGSVLIYNVYTSSTDPTRQNTRFNLTNTNPKRSTSVHLFFVDGASCSIADSYICLTANQTASFLASDLDPGATGYLVAVATDALGCPINFNYLIGDEYVKFSSGHAANLAAESVSAIAGGLPLCDANSTVATLAFDGVSYSVVPRVLALDNVGSRADGNDTMLILNRIGGNLGTGASTLGTIFGLLYDDAESGLSFSVTGTCQLRNSLSNNFPRTAPRFETFIPAGRSGWLKVFSQTDIGISGAAINFNPNALTSAGAFNQGHNLHVLTTTNTANYTIPVFPPGC